MYKIYIYVYIYNINKCLCIYRKFISSDKSIKIYVYKVLYLYVLKNRKTRKKLKNTKKKTRLLSPTSSALSATLSSCAPCV